uniref:Deoxyhypusine monooxygenase n=2 Tax=Hymenolepis diminuta TaxID=6216 RepID=A0A0R3SNY7_HYMDI
LGRIEWLQRPKKIPDPVAELAKSKYPNTVDPAPSFEPSTKYPISQLSGILLSTSESLFARYQALFSLRNAAVITTSGKSEPSIHFSDVVEALSASLSAPGSALLRHEVAFILGQLSISRTGDSLIERIQDQSEAPMVRHEAAIALGKIADTAEVEEKQGTGDGGCNGLAERARKALLAGCKDSEPVVRDSCALALDMADYASSNERFHFAAIPAN